MINAQLAALSAASRGASPAVGLQAPTACLLSAAASLLEAAQLLKQPDSSAAAEQEEADGTAAAEREEPDGSDGNAAAARGEADSGGNAAAELHAALASYLSLACDLLQGHRPTAVCLCCSLHSRDTKHLTISPFTVKALTKVI